MGIYFGDLHCHCGITYGYGSLANALDSARSRLDFCSVTPHAMWPDIPELDQYNRYLVTYHKEAFRKIRQNWDSVSRQIEDANEDGTFVAFHSYEMHSSYYGDHHIVSPDQDMELIERSSPKGIIESIGCDAIAIPHHIAYPPGYRGINWDEFDSRISPIVEVYSKHGLGLSDNGYHEYYHTMGPRDGRNTAFAGLNRGNRFSFAASTDHHAGFPGSYGDGLIAVDAEDLSRKALWDAIKAGRTYAVTGDRIICDFSVDDLKYGQEGELDSLRHISCHAVAADEIVRIVVYRNLKPIHVYDSFMNSHDSSSNRYKIRLELGWGSNDTEGYIWNTSMHCEDGRIIGCEYCIRGRSVLAPSEHRKADDDINRLLFEKESSEYDLSFNVETFCNPSPLQGQTSSVVIEMEGTPETLLRFDINGKKEELTIGMLQESSRCGEMLSYASNSYKIHRAVPKHLYDVAFDFADSGSSGDFYHMEVYERNGNAAFVSPVFIN